EAAPASDHLADAAVRAEARAHGVGPEAAAREVVVERGGEGGRGRDGVAGGRALVEDERAAARHEPEGVEPAQRALPAEAGDGEVDGRRGGGTLGVHGGGLGAQRQHGRRDGRTRHAGPPPPPAGGQGRVNHLVYLLRNI